MLSNFIFLESITLFSKKYQLYYKVIIAIFFSFCYNYI